VVEKSEVVDIGCILRSYFRKDYISVERSDLAQGGTWSWCGGGQVFTVRKGSSAEEKENGSWAKHLSTKEDGERGLVMTQTNQGTQGTWGERDPRGCGEKLGGHKKTFCRVNKRKGEKGKWKKERGGSAVGLKGWGRKRIT